MRICFWSTTFQADNQALAHHLGTLPDVDLTVAVSEPSRVLAEPIHQLMPIRAKFVDRDGWGVAGKLAKEGYDLLVVDNHLPSQAIASRVLVMWHGFGWRVDDLKTTRKELGRLVGEVCQPNPHFRWQAFGDWDRQYRIEHSCLAPENVVALGSTYSDWLLPGSVLRERFERSAFAHHYSIDLTRKVVLLGLTWHHGGSFGHWGDEERLLTELVDSIRDAGASTLLRMHDRKRYTGDYVRLVERLATRFPECLMLKWKDESPDSSLDLLVSDVCISNYSSLLNAFYYTHRPSIHVDPHDAGGSRSHTYKMFLGMPMRRAVHDAADLWKLPPTEHGGLRAQSFTELLAHVARSLREPDCCADASAHFIARYVTCADGHTAERVARYIKAWFASG
jgi:hypothetical protein